MVLYALSSTISARLGLTVKEPQSWRALEAVPVTGFDAASLAAHRGRAMPIDVSLGPGRTRAPRTDRVGVPG